MLPNVENRSSLPLPWRHGSINTQTQPPKQHHTIIRYPGREPTNQPTSQQQERPARPRKGNTESDHGNNIVTSKAIRQSRSVVVFVVARPGRTHTKKSCGHTHTHTASLWTHGPCPSHGIIIPQVPFAPRADEWAQPWSSTESGEWSRWW